MAKYALCSDQQQRILHRQMKAGSVEARQQLAASVMPRAIQVAQSLGAKLRLDEDDILSAAGLAVTQWLSHWNPKKGRATTLLQYWVRASINATSDKAGPIPHPAKLRAPVPNVVHGDGTGVQCDRYPSPITAAICQEQRETIQHAVDQLPPRLKAVVHFRFLNQPQATLAQTGTLLGITRERVRQLELVALNQLESQLQSI
jgi:RNA polymerase sigma factor (sigma-70 family)